MTRLLSKKLRRVSRCILVVCVWAGWGACGLGDAPVSSPDLDTEVSTAETDSDQDMSGLEDTHAWTPGPETDTPEQCEGCGDLFRFPETCSIMSMDEQSLGVAATYFECLCGAQGVSGVCSFECMFSLCDDNPQFQLDALCQACLATRCLAERRACREDG